MALDVTPRNEKPARPAWVEEITKKVILKKEGSFVKALYSANTPPAAAFVLLDVTDFILIGTYTPFLRSRPTSS